MASMEELNPIREWLNECRGTWAVIAERAGVSTKTLQRIASGDSQSVNLRTYTALRADMEARSKDPRTAA